MAEPMHTPDVNSDGTVGTVTGKNAPVAKTEQPVRPDAPNLSTEHQEKGGAIEVSDTLDRPRDAVHPAKDFDPVEDVGNPEPSGRGEHRQ